MLGNVYQWCCDSPRGYKRFPVDDPREPKTYTQFEMRGGSFWPAAWICRSAFRLINEPKYRNEDVGLRVCLTKPRAPVGRSKTSGAKSPSAIDLGGPAAAPFAAGRSRSLQERFARQSGLPLEITNSIGMKLVLIPSGEFDMGSTDEMIENDCHTHSADEWYLDRVGLEWPMHHVRITQPLYLGVYDVTQEQYERVMRENPSYFSPTGGGKDQVAGRNTRRYPVECVSFDDALAFCRRLSILPDETIAGRAYRLPSEAEWEYACRAGNPGRCYFSVGSKPTAAAFDEQHAINFAWYEWGGSTHEVGQRSPNAWGLYDMNGNVFQWCQDVFARNYFSQSPVNDPPGPADGYFRVNRGGGAHGWYFSRSAFRQFSPPTWHFMDLGFRVCFLPASNHLSRPTQPPQIRGLQKKLARRKMKF